MLLVDLRVLPLTVKFRLLLEVEAVVHARVVGRVHAALHVSDLVVRHILLLYFLVLDPVHERTLPYFLVKSLVEARYLCHLGLVFLYLVDDLKILHLGWLHVSDHVLVPYRRKVGVCKRPSVDIRVVNRVHKRISQLRIVCVALQVKRDDLHHYAWLSAVVVVV